MKSIFYKIVLILTMVFFIGTYQVEANPMVAHTLDAQVSNLSFQFLLNISPHEYTKLTGKKLNFSQVLKLKIAQNLFKTEVLKSKDLDEEPKSQIIAIVICLLVGFLGVHRFYLGYTSIGILQALTLGGCLIWWIIDIILILTGTLGPADGSEYYPKFNDV